MPHNSALTARWGDYSACVVDPDDGCFWIANEHAAATNLWGTHVAGIADACGCIGIPDVDEDGRILASDVSAYREQLADLPSQSFATDKCQVLDAGSGTCDVLQLVVLARALTPPGEPGLEQVCAAARL